MEKKVTKAELMGYLRKMLTTNKTWAIAALLRIYANQTASEQAGKDTHNLNGVGFTVGDAHLLTSAGSDAIGNLMQQSLVLTLLSGEHSLAYGSHDFLFIEVDNAAVALLDGLYHCSFICLKRF